MYLYVHTAFKAALAEADYQRREYIRVKEGKKEGKRLELCLGATSCASENT